MNGSLLFVPSGGLANRMRAVVSAYELCQKVDSTLQVVWFQDWALHAPFRSIFEETPLVAIREATVLDPTVPARRTSSCQHCPSASSSSDISRNRM